MRNKPVGTPADRAVGETDSGHKFSAKGTASIIRCVRDAVLEWETAAAFGVEAGGGMSES